MKVKLLFLAPALAFTLLAAAQKNTPPVNNDKYRINLPSYWGKGNKVWKVLTDKLPLICGELVAKELCGDKCNPKYSVDFYITEPTVLDYTSKKVIAVASTDTRYLLQKPIPPQGASDYVNSPNNNNDNSWQVITNYTFQCFLLLKNEKGDILTRMILVDTNEVWEKINPVLSTVSGPPLSSYIETNKEKFRPVSYDLLAIADKKILAL